MVFIRDMYDSAIYAQSDFLGVIGVYEFYLISSVPGTTLNYLSIIQPFDVLAWAWIGASVMSILAALIVINEVSVKKMKKMKMSFHKSTQYSICILLKSIDC